MAEVANTLGVMVERFTRNLKESVVGMSPEKWIRLVIVVGTYLLVRPYLIKIGGKVQMKQHEKEAAEAQAEAEAKEKAKMSPNELRGHKVQIPDESDDSEGEGEGEGEASSTDWGKKARRRQRTMIKKMLEAEEKRLQDLQDDDEDKDIQEFLID